ncbi:hypothetical protein [Luteipulveratus flavus]|uniref:DUF4352 domain-containing protein n=1 Tax=Luteipulveratus flavus TaxID=3031728 RepID=A0ABT6CC44_9MICO|nr:hypothetical protein [Luteipulveratus sp. YIM 133296]MDF8266478.1 hypothetical protein [Luteipulveratus sp. YIM 133296]
MPTTSRPVALLLSAAALLSVTGCSGSAEPTSARTPLAPQAAATGPSASYTSAPPTGRGAEQPTTAPAPRKKDLAKQPHGSIHQTVAPHAVRTQQASARSATDAGVTVEVTGHASVKATARVPGEVSGDAVRVTLRIANGSAGPLDLDAVTVDLRDARGASASALSTAPTQPFRGRLAVGGRASGTYVFVIPTASRKGSTLVVSPTARSLLTFPNTL